MDLDRLKDIAREAALLNIKYYSHIVDLSRDYLASLREMVGDTASGSPGRAEVSAAAGSPVSPPLILAGRTGETAEAVFSVSNQLNRQVGADVLVAGDLPLDKIRTEPQGKMLDPGEECIFRLSCVMDESLEIGRDRHGIVSVPGLARRSIPIVVRRLPGQDPKAGSSGVAKSDLRKKAAPRAEGAAAGKKKPTEST
jgi:hypothetical protein